LVPDKYKDKCILIVDDQASIRAITRAYLMDAGFRFVIDACSAAVALDELEKYSVDLILCDVNMPEMSGLELLELIRQDPRLEHIAVLIFTAHADVACVRKAMALNVCGFIIKPFQPLAMCKKIIKAFIQHDALLAQGLLETDVVAQQVKQASAASGFRDSNASFS